MKKERGNLLNLFLMLFHWLIADAAVALGFLFQLSFPKDPNPDASVIYGKIYQLNIPLYILGTVMRPFSGGSVFFFILPDFYVGFSRTIWTKRERRGKKA